jgi:hypothetical protein
MDDFMLSTLWLQVNLGKRDKEITPHNFNKEQQRGILYKRKTAKRWRNRY